MSEGTTQRTLKQMSYSSRRPHRVSLLSAENRKLHRLKNLQLVTIWMVLFLFSPNDTTSTLCINYIKCALVGPKDIFSLCVSSSWLSSGLEKLVVCLDVVDI